MLDLARFAPAAGNTDGREFVVLAGDETASYWDLTLPPERRSGFRWQGLLDAPVLVVCLVRPAAWPERYAEDDKSHPALGSDPDAWPVPYWWVDGGMAVMTILHAAHDLGLGALFFGLFDHERLVLDHLGVPDDRRAVGTIAIGHHRPEAPGRSAGRLRRGLDQIVHRGRWSAGT